MSKLLIAILVLLLPGVSSAQYFADEWQAFFSERSCFVGMKATQGNSKEYDFLEAKVSFYRPHLKSERSLEDFPNVIADPVIFSVQVLPLWSEVEEIPLSAVEVKYDNIRSKLTLDLGVGDSDVPAYFLGGHEAASAWKHLKADRDLFVVLTYEVDREIEIEVSYKRIKVASAMYDVCVTVSSEKDDR